MAAFGCYPRSTVSRKSPAPAHTRIPRLITRHYFPFGQFSVRCATRQNNFKNSSIGFCWSCGQPSAVGFGDGLADRKAHAHAIALGREERVENAGQYIRVDPGPGVFDRDDDFGPRSPPIPALGRADVRLTANGNQGALTICLHARGSPASVRTGRGLPGCGCSVDSLNQKSSSPLQPSPARGGAGGLHSVLSAGQPIWT